MNVEVLGLPVLPPAVRPLEVEAADGVVRAAVTRGVLVDLLPEGEVDVGLSQVVLATLARVVGVRAELRVEEGQLELVGDALEEVS